jgi:hypothetical protein
MSAVVISVSCVEYRAVFVKKIPSINIVDKSIHIVVDTISRIKRVSPDIHGQIGMASLYSFVDDTYVHIR